MNITGVLYIGVASLDGTKGVLLTGSDAAWMGKLCRADLERLKPSQLIIIKHRR